MEKMIKECMKEYIKFEDGMVVVESVYKILIAVVCKVIFRDEEQFSNILIISLVLLFVDWLELLDSEFVVMVLDFQQQLLFVRERLQGAFRQSVVYSSQFYFLIFLIYQSSWAFLRRCVNCLFQLFEVFRLVIFLCICMLIVI